MHNSGFSEKKPHCSSATRVFLMNVTDTAEAHKLSEALPLGQVNIMAFELIPLGPLWSLGLPLAEPAK
jgi:hypothetical protein